MAKNTQERPEGGAKGIYEKLKTDREDYTKRAEDCATVTIPHIFAKEQDDGSTSFSTPNQSVGARGVNNLASKLLLAMLPPNQPFFRLSLGAEQSQALLANPDGQLEEAIDYILSTTEQSMMKYMESNLMRPTIGEALKLLVVTGNALLYLPPKEGGIKCYNLRNYVVQRDGKGDVIQLVALDVVSLATLEPEIRDALPSSVNTGGADVELEKEVEVYTHVYRSLEDEKWYSYVEIEGEVIEALSQEYPLNETPWIPLRFNKRDGEHYGRSFVDDYLGDLESLETLSKAMNDIAMVASKIVFLVNPSCVTNVRQLAKCQSGDFVRGRQEDIVPLQINKTSDLQITQVQATALESRLSYAFLLNSAVQRNGERVTAEEIRYVAGELEDTLGGVYGLLSQELQLPLVKRVFLQMKSQNLISEDIEGLGELEPTITTGVEALGRGHDLNKLTTALQLLAQLGPEALSAIDMNMVALRVFSSVGVDVKGIVKSTQQMQGEAQAQAEQVGAEAYAQQAGQNMANQQMM